MPEHDTPLTVRELIELLANENPDALVVPGGGGGQGATAFPFLDVKPGGFVRRIDREAGKKRPAHTEYIFSNAGVPCVELLF